MDVPESIGLENIFKNFIGKGKKKKKKDNIFLQPFIFPVRVISNFS